MEECLAHMCSGISFGLRRVRPPSNISWSQGPKNVTALPHPRAAITSSKQISPESGKRLIPSQGPSAVTSSQDLLRISEQVESRQHRAMLASTARAKSRSSAAPSIRAEGQRYAEPEERA